MKGDAESHTVLCDLLLVEHFHFQFLWGGSERARSDQVLEPLIIEETQEVTLLTLEDQEEGARGRGVESRHIQTVHALLH